MNDHGFEAGDNGSGQTDPLRQNRLPRRRWALGAIALATLALAAVGLAVASQRKTAPESVIYLPEGQLKVAFHPAEEGPTTIRTYEVTDILKRIDQWQPGSDAESLLTICSAPTPGAAVQLEGGNLTAELTERGHERLKQMLDAWREGGPRQIAVELRVIRADLSLAASIDWADARISNLQQRGSRPVVAARISDDQLRQFIQGVSADIHSNILQAPKVTLLNGQTATIMDRVQRPFVTDVEPQEDGSLQPVVEVFDEGMTVTLRAATAGDGAVELTFDLQTSRIGEVALANLPFRNLRAPHEKVIVQVPSVSILSIASTVRLPATQSLLIAAPQPFQSSGDAGASTAIFYALTPRLLDAPKVDHEVEQVAASPPSVPAPEMH